MVMRIVRGDEVVFGRPRRQLLFEIRRQDFFSGLIRRNVYMCLDAPFFGFSSGECCWSGPISSRLNNCVHPFGVCRCGFTRWYITAGQRRSWENVCTFRAMTVLILVAPFGGLVCFL